MELIDKDALVAEIDNLENTYKKCPTRNSYEEGLKVGRLIGYEDALYKINTLEVKEVDLNKELSLEDYKSFFKKHPDLSDDWGFDEAWMFAKYFYELGLKAQKGE